MKRRPTQVLVSDHAVLRWLQREHGLDTNAVRRHIAGLARNGAELGAVAVCIGQVRLVLKVTGASTTVVTSLPRDGGFRPDQ